jgi:uncharacterized membrane protein required for colicin V production
MNISPAIIIDVALIAVIVVSVFHYARKGFVAGLMDLVGNLASLALAWVVSGKLSPTVFENFFKSGLIEQTARTIQQQGGVNLSVILDGLSGILPQKFIDDITASAAGMLDSGAPDIAQQVVEKIIAPLVVFATFVLCRVVIAFLVTVLTNINKIPLLGGVNRILGVCIGVVAGFINVLLILCLLWAVVVITNGNLPFANDSSLSGSYFYSFFSAYNPFL